MISVDKIETLELFREHRENWEEVYRQDSEAEYFLSWNWLSQIYESRSEGVFILAVKMSASSSNYCAFLPLRREVRFSDSKQRFFNCFSMAGNYWADSTGLICDSDVEKYAIPALAYALKTLSWHRILFESLSISPQRRAWLMEPFPKQNYSVHEKSHTDNRGKTDLSRSPFVDLPKQFDLYLEQKTSANTRQKIRRIRRKIDSDSSLSIEIAESASIERYIKFFELAWIENWKDMKGRSTRHLALKYSKFIRMGVRAGNMIVPVLLHKSKPVGLLACYKDPVKKQLLFFVAGRDADFDLVPSGLALHAFCIEWAIENSYTRYNLLRGDEPYKYSLGAIDTQLNNIVLFKRDPSISAQLLDYELKKPALRILTKVREGRSTAAVHNLYGQLLESWPGDAGVLSHYAIWLESVGESVHARDIKKSLMETRNEAGSTLTGGSTAKTIDMEPLIGIQQWLDDIARKRQSVPTLGSLTVKGLRLELASSDLNCFGWLKSYLHPLVSESVTAESNGSKSVTASPNVSKQSISNISSYRLVCMTENELIVKIMRLVKSANLDVSLLKLAGRGINRIHLTSELTIDIDRHNGVVWVSDNESRQLTLLMSSRVTWPSLEVSRTARALIIAYLQQENWIFLHSGAVCIDNKNYLIVGDEGQGKTSLILALMSDGCQYISNERVFVRTTENQIEALSFPMPVAIGMGTAQQYPEVMQYVRNPEYCLYPHRRMDTNKLRSTPESKWTTLSDKVQLLVPELMTLFGGSEALQGGRISGLIVPSIVRNSERDFQDRAYLLNKKDMARIVRRNHISTTRDTRYPAWLPLAFNRPPTDSINKIIESISTLPSIRFEYLTSKECKDAEAGYTAIIKEAMHAHSS